MQRKPALFKHAQITKLARLMDMQYKPSELAREIGVTADTVTRSYIPAGLPVTKDATGHIWINGLVFAKWAHDLNLERKKSKRAKLPDNQAYCFKCKKPVVFKQKSVTPTNRYLEIIQGVCLTCKGKVFKMRGRKAK